MIHFCNALRRLVFLLAAVLPGYVTLGQGFLGRSVSVTSNQQSVAQVLNTIGSQGGFYFSYNSAILPGDSLVSVSFRSVSVREALDKLLGEGYQYKETGTYLIIQRKATEKFLFVSGMVVDSESGGPVDFASVYSKTKFNSDLTSDKGTYRLRFREGSLPLSISVSKVGYADTTVLITSTEPARIILVSRPVELDPVWVRYSEAERTWLGRLFVSDELRLQSRNIGKFFVSLPYQASLTPGLSTHGRMNSQIENKVSLNLIGGYSGGVNGVEIAGMFNITKRSVRYVQVAGWFNVTSSDVNGVQAAGIYNHVLDSLQGVQVAGGANVLLKSVHGAQIGGIANISGGNLYGVQVSAFGNIAKGSGRGAQISGIFNHVDSSFHGAQVSGLFNSTFGTVSGVQVAGIANSGRQTDGAQIGFFNKTRHLRGVQVGLVNYADSSSGASIGLINIIRHGRSNLTLYANEIAPLNVAWKMGNRNIYTMITGGMGLTNNNRLYTLGFGVGNEFPMSKLLSLQAEVTTQSIILNQWDNAGGLVRMQMSLVFNLSERFSAFAGPAFSIYYNRPDETPTGTPVFPPDIVNQIPVGDHASGWIGVQAGISWRYGRR